jgi:hypothetical protein
MEREFFYACTAGIGAPPKAEFGLARCRNPQPCSIHQNGALWAKAPIPDVVLFKVNISKNNRDWDRLPLLERTEERSWQLTQAHLDQLRHLGIDRDTLRYREARGEDTKLPEADDTGVPIFNEEDGLQFVDVAGVIPELHKAGYLLIHAHRLWRFHKPPVRLVLVFAKNVTSQPLADFPWLKLKDFISVEFGQVDVWANPIDARNICVHTVNCSKRNEVRPADAPRYRLTFNSGDWDAKTI